MVVLTSVDNPLLEEIPKFLPLVTEALTKATGTAVRESDLAISASVPVSGIRDEAEPWESVRDDREKLVTHSSTN